METNNQENTPRKESEELKQKVEQVEKLLKERKLIEALDIIEPWAKDKFKKSNPTTTWEQLRKNAQEATDKLNAGDSEEAEGAANEVLYNLYLLLDMLHALACIEEKVSAPPCPFDHNKLEEISRYFFYVLTPNDKDLTWLKQIAREKKNASKAHMAISCMGHALMDCYWHDSLMALIDCIDSPIEEISERSSSIVMQTMIYYDSRVRCSTEIQEAFKKAVEKHGDDMWGNFIKHCCAVHEAYFHINDPLPEDINVDKLPKFLRKLIEKSGISLEEVLKIKPRDEEEYARMHEVLHRLPQSWVQDTMMPLDDMEEENGKVAPNSRVGMLVNMCVYIGRGEFLWDDLEQTERWLKRQLEEEHSQNPLDYLHAGHLALIKGDNDKAMDYYHKAFDLSTYKPFLHQMFRIEKGYLKEINVLDEASLNQAEEQLKAL